MYVPVASLIVDNIEDYEISEEFNCNCVECNEVCPCSSRFGSLADSRPLFECNRHCKCVNCRNTITQTSRVPRLKILKTALKGLGVFAAESISKDSYIGEYVGRLVNIETQGEYVFQIRENTPSRVIVTTIDSEYFGNFTRFFNHSCDPNLEVCCIRKDHIIPHISFFAVRDIEINEELCFQYREVHINEVCHCGSRNCQGFF